MVSHILYMMTSRAIEDLNPFSSESADSDSTKIYSHPAIDVDDLDASSLLKLDPKFDVLEEPENLFLVENKDHKLVFLYIKDDIIHERDCLSGEIGFCYDLSVISNITIAKDNPLAIIMCFDSRVQSKKLARYVFENKQALDDFKSNYCTPSLNRRKKKLSNQQKKFSCLKCGYSRILGDKEPCNSNECPKCSSVFTYLSSTTSTSSS
ncbi:uncharacterized protein LOC141857754 [Brevipalpus obovatus]|uniref:uncharacterized protein LOC141857754 n=1 Tax=Brevipalpus obovatus TaxID=246614 RepID=UPI003D9F47D6